MADRVFVGLSGGVDSAVAAARLLEQGFDVVGVFIKVWHPDFMVCNWEAERLDAMRVAAHLGIPFLTCDAESTYRDAVAQSFIEDYKAGRTPNPDVLCNQHVKFGAFLSFALERGARYIATGHYARRHDVASGPTLLRGIDKTKDQSYFLWSLTTEQLNHSLFPVGDTAKANLRAEAERRGLPVFNKRDSQGICFLGQVDIKEFLSHYVPLTPGTVLDTEGREVGTHEGALIYTLGQRHGFTVRTQSTVSIPHYVIRKNLSNNTITVSTAPPQATSTSTLILHKVVLRAPLTIGDTIEVQTRYRQSPYTATITSLDKDTLSLSPHHDTEAAASGQSCVIYRTEECIGGGIIA